MNTITVPCLLTLIASVGSAQVGRIAVPTTPLIVVPGAPVSAPSLQIASPSGGASLMTIPTLPVATVMQTQNIAAAPVVNASPQQVLTSAHEDMTREGADKAAVSAEVFDRQGRHSALAAETAVVRPSAEISPVLISASGSSNYETNYGLMITKPSFQLEPGRAGYLRFGMYYEGSFLRPAINLVANLSMDLNPCSAEYNCQPGDSVIRFGESRNPDGSGLIVSPRYVVVPKGSRSVSMRIDATVIVKTTKRNWLGMEKEIFGEMPFTFDMTISSLK